jgi:dTDP-4-dehydrorhamnose 3,5-epimerase
MRDLIDGVNVTDLKLVKNERGQLMEVQRCDDPLFPGFGQVYVTKSFNGVVKAWYRHRRQIDQISAISGLVKLVLYDDRESSSTKGQVDEIMLGEPTPRLVLIPPGIWHGFQAIGDTDAFLLHLNTVAFNAGDPDEERLPKDDDTIPYRW